MERNGRERRTFAFNATFIPGQTVVANIRADLYNTEIIRDGSVVMGSIALVLSYHGGVHDTWMHAILLDGQVFFINPSQWTGIWS